MFKRKDERVSITAAELQIAIGQALKAAPSCEDFVGVVVRPKTSKSPTEPNWDVRGVKFGKADRMIVSDALAKVVTRLQQEFRLVGNNASN
jgi:hypothetical protein